MRLRAEWGRETSGFGPRSWPGSAHSRPPTSGTPIATRVLAALDERTLEILERRRRARRPKSRGWLLRRLLLAADLLGLSLAFLLASVVVGGVEGQGALDPWVEFGIFLATLPVWIVAAKLFGLYDRDEFLADHSTLDDFTRVLLLVTLGRVLVRRRDGLLGNQRHEGAALLGLRDSARHGRARRRPRGVAGERSRTSRTPSSSAPGTSANLSRASCSSTPSTGSTSSDSSTASRRTRRADLRHLTLLGTPDELPDIVRLLGVERVIIAFSRDDPQDDAADLIRSLGHPRPDRHRAAAVRDRRAERRACTRSRRCRCSGFRPRGSARSSMLIKRATGRRRGGAPPRRDRAALRLSPLGGSSANRLDRSSSGSGGSA